MIKIISRRYIDWIRKRKGVKTITAVTGFPGIVVFRDKESSLDKVLCNHEAIHQAQIWDGWVIGHWILYSRFDKKYGYRNNPFEKEAYANQSNLDYLKDRKRNAWREYLLSNG